MALSVEENVLRCMKKFGDRIDPAMATRWTKWRQPFRMEPKARPEESEKGGTAKDGAQGKQAGSLEGREEAGTA